MWLLIETIKAYYHTGVYFNVTSRRQNHSLRVYIDTILVAALLTTTKVLEANYMGHHVASNRIWHLWRKYVPWFAACGRGWLNALYVITICGIPSILEEYILAFTLLTCMSPLMSKSPTIYCLSTIKVKLKQAVLIDNVILLHVGRMPWELNDCWRGNWSGERDCVAAYRSDICFFPPRTEIGAVHLTKARGVWWKQLQRLDIKLRCALGITMCHSLMLRPISTHNNRIRIHLT